jgi:uroporphyrinogen decarboxylase
MHFAARFHGTTYAKFASDYKTLVESNIRCLEHFDLDAVSLISDPYRETAAFGARIEYVPEGVPKCLDKIIGNAEDVTNLKVPDVYQCERTLDRIKGAAYFQQLLKGTVPVGGWIEGPLAEACDLAGVGEMLMFLMTDPDMSNALLDKCLHLAKDFAKAQVDAGCDFIGMGDAICSQIDADTYDFYVRDRHLELVEYIHSLGAKVKLHICGNIKHLLPSISTLNFDIVDLDWQVDLPKASLILGEKVVIKGNINPVFIQDSTPEKIEVAVMDLVKKMEGIKFILSGGCEITVNTPVANLLSMSKALKSSL